MVAGLTWFWAIQLPNVPVTNETETTLMHFLGGAVISPALFAYFVRTYDYTMPMLWWQRLVMFLAFPFGMFAGLNEVLEFVLTKAGLITIELSDASWDI